MNSGHYPVILITNPDSMHTPADRAMYLHASSQNDSGDTVLKFGDSCFSFESPLCQVSAYGVFSQGHFQAEL